MLRSFAVVAEEGHVGRAARRLFITQPALSKRIRRIEALIGTRLVQPEGRGISLTPAGIAFAAAVPAAIRAIDDAVELARATARAAAGEVVVGFVPPMPQRITTDLMREAGDRGCAEVVLRSISWDQQVSAVTSGHVDVALVRGPVEDEPGIVTEVLFEEPRVAALHAGHRLAGADTLELSDLTAEPIIVTAPNTDFWVVNPRPDGKPPVFGPTASSVAEILETVASGRAMALPAKSMGEYYVRSDIAYVPVRDVAPSVVLLVRSVRPKTAAEGAVLDLIRERADPRVHREPVARPGADESETSGEPGV